MPIFNEYGNLTQLPENHPIIALDEEIHRKVSALMLSLIQSGEISLLEARALQEHWTTATSVACGESILRHCMKLSRQKREAKKV